MVMATIKFLILPKNIDAAKVMLKIAAGLDWLKVRVAAAGCGWGWLILSVTAVKAYWSHGCYYIRGCQAANFLLIAKIVLVR